MFHRKLEIEKISVVHYTLQHCILISKSDITCEQKMILLYFYQQILANVVELLVTG